MACIPYCNGCMLHNVNKRVADILSHNPRLCNLVLEELLLQKNLKDVNPIDHDRVEFVSDRNNH